LKDFNISQELQEIAPGVAVTGVEEEDFIYIHRVMYKNIQDFINFMHIVDDNIIFTDIVTDTIENILIDYGYILIVCSDQFGIINEAYVKENRATGVPGYIGSYNLGDLKYDY